MLGLLKPSRFVLGNQPRDPVQQRHFRCNLAAASRAACRIPPVPALPAPPFNLPIQLPTEMQSVTSDAAGNFGFLSLAPGSYKVSVEAKGFSKAEADITLLTAQTLQRPDYCASRVGV